jgi:hypothetical protein
MLGMKSYARQCIDNSRAKVEADLLAWRFFNDQVLLLDHTFVHRLPGIEGKDGNPLNEVRVLCNSILLNEGKLQVDKLPGWPNSAGASLKKKYS